MTNQVQEAIDWINEFLREGRGTGVHPGYIEKHVEDAFHRLNECASGVEGLTKKAVAPALLVMLSEITALFSFLRISGLSLDEWSLSVIQLVKKKGNSLVDLSNFRGVHLLCFFRQWFVQCFVPELEALCDSTFHGEPLVPIFQQGFVPGRRIYASYMSLYALVEKGRLSKRRLYVCFVDVKRAFPSVRREILLQ